MTIRLNGNALIAGRKQKTADAAMSEIGTLISPSRLINWMCNPFEKGKRGWRATMKKLCIMTLFVFLSAGISFASDVQKQNFSSSNASPNNALASGAPEQDSFYRTYIVIEVTDKTITIQDKYGNKIVLDDRDPKDYKVGDVVRYDRIRNRLHKKHPPRTY